MNYFRTAIIAILILIFVASGSAKLFNMSALRGQFEHFGLPLWFMWFTGIVEIAGAVGLLIPTAMTRRVAGLLLAVVMCAGAGFHFLYDPPQAAIPAIILAVMSAWIAFSENSPAKPGK